jgi:acylphosphatase
LSSIGAEIKVEGFVQGVGFRYFVFKSANTLDLTGWVKNIPDGSVLVYAEGGRGQIDDLINQLKIGPGAADVRDVKVRWTEFSGKFKSFEVVG